MVQPSLHPCGRRRAFGKAGEPGIDIYARRWRGQQPGRRRRFPTAASAPTYFGPAFGLAAQPGAVSACSPSSCWSCSSAATTARRPCTSCATDPGLPMSTKIPLAGIGYGLIAYLIWGFSRSISGNSATSRRWTSCPTALWAFVFTSPCAPPAPALGQRGGGRCTNRPPRPPGLSGAAPGRQLAGFSVGRRSSTVVAASLGYFP